MNFKFLNFSVDPMGHDTARCGFDVGNNKQREFQL